MSHPYRITPCPTCNVAAGDPCTDSPTSVGVHRARWAAARAVYRHEREQRWAATMSARAIHNAKADPAYYRRAVAA